MKTVYEFYYSLFRERFSAYVRKVDRETEKMLYGTTENVNGNICYGRFAIKKDSLNVVEATHEYEYRIRVEEDSLEVALEKAKNLMVNFLAQKSERVKTAKIK